MRAPLALLLALSAGCAGATVTEQSTNRDGSPRLDAANRVDALDAPEALAREVLDATADVADIAATDAAGETRPDGPLDRDECRDAVERGTEAVRTIAYAGPPGDLFVATDGDDTAAGDEAHPLATLGAAQVRVRAAVAAGLAADYRVVVRGGTYHLAAPLSFGAADSPASHKVTWAGAVGETVLLSGASALPAKWRCVAGDVWELASPAGTDGTGQLWQLFRDGQRLANSRYPGYGNYRRLTVSRVSADRTHVDFTPEFPLPSVLGAGARLMSLIQWTAPVVPVRCAPCDGYAVGLTDRAQVSVPPSLEPHWFDLQPGSGGYISNVALEAVPADRDVWQYETTRKVLRYRSPAGDDPNDHEFTVPGPDQLLVVRGGSNLAFADLQVEYAAGFHYPLMTDGTQAVLYTTQAGWLVTNKATFYDGEVVSPGAVDVSDSRSVTFDRVTVAHAGGTGVRFTGPAILNVAFRDGTVQDVGMDCLMVGDFTEPATSLDVNRTGVTLTGNTFQSCGRLNPSAAGAWQGFTAGTTFSNNHVRDVPYTGVSWGWNFEARDAAPTRNHGNTLQGNDVSDVCLDLMDCGGIYTVGANQTSTIADNVVHDVHTHAQSTAPINFGLYFDSASAGFTVRGNTVYGYDTHAVWFQTAAGAAQARRSDFTVGDNRFSVTHSLAGEGTPALATLARWRLDEGAGAGVDGDRPHVLHLAAGSSQPTWDFTGYSGAALTFSASTSPLQLGESNSVLDFRGRPFTVDFWMWPDADARAYVSILGKGGGSAWEQGWGFTFGEARTLEFWVDGELHASTAPAPAAGTWHHVVGSYDGASVQLTVDGVASTPKAYAASLTPTSLPFQVGRLAVGGNGGFLGTLDEVTVRAAPIWPRYVAREPIFYWDMNQWASGSTPSVAVNTQPLVATVAPTVVAGRGVGSAVQLDRTQTLRLATGNELLAFPSNAMTTSFWMRSAGACPDYTAILGKGGGASWESGWAFACVSGYLLFWVDGISHYASFLLPTPGEWHHVVGTYDGLTVRLFVDGVEGTPRAYAATMTPTTVPFQVGWLSSGGAGGFVGAVDEVRVFDAALLP